MIVRPLASIVHTVPWPEIHSHFEDTGLQRFGRAEIARFEPPNVCIHPRGSGLVQTIKPLFVRRTAIFRKFPNLKRAIHRVSFMLPVSICQS